jgi:hypothetical protein
MKLLPDLLSIRQSNNSIQIQPPIRCDGMGQLVVSDDRFGMAFWLLWVYDLACLCQRWHYYVSGTLLWQEI